MASLASIKRSIRVGTKVTLTHHSGHGPGDTFKWGQGEITLPCTREVGLVQTNSIAMIQPGLHNPHVHPSQANLTWLYWPKAAEVRVEDERTFAITNVGSAGEMRYVVEPASA